MHTENPQSDVFTSIGYVCIKNKTASFLREITDFCIYRKTPQVAGLCVEST